MVAPPWTQQLQTASYVMPKLSVYWPLSSLKQSVRVGAEEEEEVVELGVLVTAVFDILDGDVEDSIGDCAFDEVVFDDQATL